MKLTKRQLYDYRDVERPELMLIRAGQHVWRLWKQAQRRPAAKSRLNLYVDHQEVASLEASLETIWQAKREYRAERKAREAVEYQKLTEKLNKAREAKR